MDTKTGLGAAAIVVGAVVMYALAGMDSGLPYLLGGVGVLAMAAGSLMVGMAGERAV